MNLSIITINYNGSESTKKLLASLGAQTDKDFKIIVIDNASTEEDVNRLADGLDGSVIFIKNKENSGFSGGNNLGIKIALENGSDWVLLLNNDTSVETEFIAGLKAKLGVLGGIIGLPLNEEGHLAYAGKIRWFRHTLPHKHRPVTHPGANYVIGGALAIHRDVFKKIGYLDEKYFLYFEDADFSFRALKAGVPVNFLMEPIVSHQVSTTTKKLGSPLLLRYHYRNSFYFNFKNGPWYVKILIWPWSFWIMKKELFKIIFMYKRHESSAILMAVIDFYKNKMGKINV